MTSRHQGDHTPTTTASPEHMSGEDMMRMRHQRELWANFAVIALGVWLASSPWTFGYADEPWLPWSDLVSGLLIAILGFLSISYRNGWARWANTVIGIWLLFAPLVFWAPDAVTYVNDTLIGSLVIAFSILVPGMPGMRMLPGPDAPPGWTYNPSGWVQRAPVIALGLVSFFIARYLAAYQFGYIDDAWDPIFGNGTVRILESDVSRAWPISDAGFGAVAYMLESLSGFMGNQRRWRMMPWMVLMFGILVIPLGITSIVLVILQPVMVGTWCALCLLTALFMLLMIPLAVDEVVAMGQFMRRIHQEDKPFWTTFWRGGTIDEDEDDTVRRRDLNEQGEAVGFHAPLARIAETAVRGVTIPWNLALSALIGLWLMGAPPALDADGWAANSDFLVGPLIAVVAISAWAEVIRPFRYVNVLLGAWLVVAPWLLSGATTASTINDMLAGLILIGLSLPRGPVTERYGAWNQRIR